jgi:hypothetical protein
MEPLLKRGRSLWQRLTGRPEGHEGPWPVDTGSTWRDSLAAATFLLGIAMAVSTALAEFGAHPMLRSLATVVLLWLGDLTIRARRSSASRPTPSVSTTPRDSQSSPRPAGTPDPPYATATSPHGRIRNHLSTTASSLQRGRTYRVMRSHTDLRLRSARPDDHTAALDLLTAAAGDNPVQQWAEPDPTRRTAQTRCALAALLEHAAVHDTIRVAETAGTLIGVAVWFLYPLGPGATDVHDLPLHDSNAAQSTDSAIRLGLLAKALKDRHPAVTPHHYLAGLAIHTDHQDRGVGAALLNDHHAGQNHSRTPAYLEADDWRHRDRYRTVGYTDIGPPVTIDGSHPCNPCGANRQQPPSDP